MSQGFYKQTSGGKGNMGLFIERDRKICAAGTPTAQPEQNVKDRLNYYSLQDEVNALVRDAVTTSPKVSTLPPLRHKIKRDMRNAGIFSEGSQLINPPVKTKFQTLVEDFKTTNYNSYWNKEVGKIPDPVPMLPEGFKIKEKVTGKKTPFYVNLYDIIMPIDPLLDNTTVSKRCSYQKTYNYCSFDANATFGIKCNTDRTGKYMKCCLTDDNIHMGTALKTVITERQSKFQLATTSTLGMAHSPNENIKSVPKGFTFGILKPPDNLPECLRTCELNPYKDHIKQCLGHLNTLRKCLAKRVDGNFFHKLYLSFKNLDQSKSGWLQKVIIYKRCNAKFIRFDPCFLEPLLAIWHAFDGSHIEYKIFTHVINYREPSPELPKIQDMGIECIDFRTTYNEMCKENLNIKNERMAGLPSGRYFDMALPITPDGYCKADKIYLPQESDMKACINPNVFTLLGISHRDMYTKREPHIVRRVFEKAGITFENGQFENIWEMAKKHHPQKWVCFETFRQSMDECSTINTSE